MSEKTDNKCIIFDFDGTLADTFYKAIEIINRDPEKYGIDNINPIEVTQLKDFSLKYIIREFNISLVKIPVFRRMITDSLEEEIKQVTPFEGIMEVLNKLKDKSMLLGIITSNKFSSVKTFLEHHKIKVFDFVISEKSLFGKDKVIKKVLKEQNLDPDTTYYVGDEVRDVEAAKKAGVSSVAVTWGYNSEKLLKKQRN